MEKIAPVMPEQMNIDAPDGSTDDARTEEESAADLIEMQKAFIADKYPYFGVLLRGQKVEIEPGTGFKITFREPITISLDAKDWQKMQEGEFSEEQMIWSTCHEIAHFLDMLDDPEGMIKHFGYIKEIAKQKAPLFKRKWQKAYKDNGMEWPLYASEKFVAEFLAAELHKFYNALDDVYVNNVVAIKNPDRYSPNRGERSGIISSLYSEYLFSNSDLTECPQSQQLGYAILRRNMVKNQETLVAPEVEQVLKSPTSIGGKKDTIAGLMDNLLRPTSTINNKHIPSHRYAVIRGTLEPKFWNLLEQDLATKVLPPVPEEEKEGEEGKEEQGDTGTESGEQSFFKPGDKVKDKKTGEIGFVADIKADGIVVVDFDQKEADQFSLARGQVKYYKPNDELILIKKKSESQSQQGEQPSGGPEVEYEEEPEGAGGEDKSDENKDDDKKSDESGQEGKNQQTAGQKKDTEQGQQPSGGTQEGDKTSEQEPKDSGEEGAEKSEEENPWDKIKNQPGPISEKTILDFLESKKVYEESQPKPTEPVPKLTPEERAKEAQIAYDTKLIEKYGKNIPPELAQRLAGEWQNYYESVLPYIEQLRQVFDDLISTISNQIVSAWDSGFKSGKFNTAAFIKKYAPALIAGEVTGNLPRYINFQELDVYAQREFMSRLVIYPNNIMVRLILDNSGSMRGEKNIFTKQLMVLVYEALKSFEARMNHLFRLNQPFRIDLEVQTFGDKTVLAKPRGSFGEEERGQMLSTLGFLTADEGNTRDAQAWENIIAQMQQDPKWSQLIREGKAKDLSFEFTDGETETENATRDNVQNYLSIAGAGAANAFMLSEGEAPVDDDTFRKSTFFNIFQGNGLPVSHASELPLLMAKLLKEQFDDIGRNLTLSYESFDDYEE